MKTYTNFETIYLALILAVNGLLVGFLVMLAIVEVML